MRFRWHSAVIALSAVLAGCAGAPAAGPSSPSPAAVTPGSPTPLTEPVPSPSVLASPTQVTQPVALDASLRGVEWTHIPTTRRVVALTFDGGAGNEGMASILSTLRREKVEATFFLTGHWITRNDAFVRSIAVDPLFSIANHTQDHPRLPDLSDALVRGEVDGDDSLIKAATGRSPRPAFRFPYGASDARTLRLVNDMGYAGIRWSVDTRGWMGRSAGNEDSVLQRCLDGASPGEIVVMHVGAATDGSTLDASALPRVIAELRSRGYSFVRVTDFLPGR